MAAYDHSYCKVPIELSEYAKSLEFDGKQRYIEKLSFLKSEGTFIFIPDPYTIKKEDWKNDVATWPKLTEDQIHKFVTACPGKNYKSLNAFNYVVSGKVQEVHSYFPSNMPDFIVLSAQVLPSMKTNVDGYRPWVFCVKNTIQAAHCTCLAGLGEVCSHVAALMYKVQLAVNMGITSASTEKRCQWNNSFTKKVKPVPVKDINLQKSHWSEPPKKYPKLSSVPPKNIPPLTKADLEKLREIAPNAVFFTSIDDDDDDDESTDSVSSEETNENNMSLTIQYLFKSRTISCKKDLQEIFTETIVKNIEVATRGQNSDLWLSHRCGRVTSSNFGAVLKKKKISESFAASFLHAKSINTSAIKWGKENEKEALRCYVDTTEAKHENFQMKEAGLFISTSDPYLAASPDGIVECECCGKGVVEVKCPFKHRDVHPTSIANIDKKYCIDVAGCLKESHVYYAQVQGQMALTDTQYCDFVIWTSLGLLIHRVKRDTHFWDQSQPILEKFFFEQIVPLLRK